MAEGYSDLSGALVIRGGVDQDTQGIFERLVAECEETGQRPALSVRIEAQRYGESAATTIDRACRVEPRIPHTKVQVAQAEFVQGVGVELIHTPEGGQGANHYDAAFDMPVALAQVDAFVRCFSSPIPNPTGGMRRKT